LGNQIATDAKRSTAKNQDGPRVSLTPMQSAFLAGLLALAQRATGDSSSANPVGVVVPHELREALITLKCPRGERSEAQ
jgi:hypothetical protein